MKIWMIALFLWTFHKDHCVTRSHLDSGCIFAKNGNGRCYLWNWLGQLLCPSTLALFGQSYCDIVYQCWFDCISCHCLALLSIIMICLLSFSPVSILIVVFKCVLYIHRKDCSLLLKVCERDMLHSEYCSGVAFFFYFLSWVWRVLF